MSLMTAAARCKGYNDAILIQGNPRAVQQLFGFESLGENVTCLHKLQGSLVRVWNVWAGSRKIESILCNVFLSQSLANIVSGSQRLFGQSMVEVH